MNELTNKETSEVVKQKDSLIADLEAEIRQVSVSENEWNDSAPKADITHVRASEN